MYNIKSNYFTVVASFRARDASFVEASSNFNRIGHRHNRVILSTKKFTTLGVGLLPGPRVGHPRYRM